MQLKMDKPARLIDLLVAGGLATKYDAARYVYSGSVRVNGVQVRQPFAMVQPSEGKIEAGELGTLELVDGR